jgi:Rieske Fe-S protein
MENLENPCACAGRRQLLAAMTAAGAVVTLGGCATYGAPFSTPAPSASTGAPAAPAPSGTGTASGGASGGAAGSAPAAAGPVLAQLSDIPVGGGKILASQGVVLTQPTAGTVKGFSPICTHQGCTVSTVSGGTINCPCHGSRYSITDGSVQAGPAPRSLAPVAVVVDGGAVRKG